MDWSVLRVRHYVLGFLDKALVATRLGKLSVWGRLDDLGMHEGRKEESRGLGAKEADLIRQLRRVDQSC